jgi:predicted TIM-barrel fold metal-dependent hydrolase
VQPLDCHTHFYDPSWPGGLVWPKPDAPAHRVCLPVNYREEVGEGPVVAVETSPRPQDDARLARIAGEDPMILCYVNNLQPLAEGFEHRLARSARDPKWRGLRLRPIEAYDLTSLALGDALTRLIGLGHVEIGVRDPGRLADFAALCRSLPEVRFVLTHAGHPPLNGGAAAEFDHLDGLENLFIKLSPPQNADIDDPKTLARMEAHLTKLRTLVPADRLMFGSNWPVCANPSTFREWLQGVFGWDSRETRAVLGKTARDLYRIG